MSPPAQALGAHSAIVRNVTPPYSLWYFYLLGRSPSQRARICCGLARPQSNCIYAMKGSAGKTPSPKTMTSRRQRSNPFAWHGALGGTASRPACYGSGVALILPVELQLMRSSCACASAFTSTLELPSSARCASSLARSICTRALSTCASYSCPNSSPKERQRSRDLSALSSLPDS